MMRKLLLLMTIVFLSACSSQGHNNASPQSATTFSSNDAPVPAGETESNASFAFPAVKWNNHIYTITWDEVEEVDQLLGEIEVQYSTATKETEDRSSNLLGKGTKIWSIKDTPVDEALAIEREKDKFVMLKRSSP